MMDGHEKDTLQFNKSSRKISNFVSFLQDAGPNLGSEPSFLSFLNIARKHDGRVHWNGPV